MLRRSLSALAVLVCATLGSSDVPAWGGESQEQRGSDKAAETPLDSQLLADLEILRDLEMLRQLDVLRKVEEARGLPRPRAPRGEKEKP
ncbi:MAG: hypothetical protein A2Z31_04095 [candidate division NC10 bacterium RBG_16_65_8]|nr:MAG: hypothetical protein A2Z31_04095 [candidate division NC10 bacterium RBG_16_65_8]